MTATAIRVVNAVPYVIAAAPGLLSSLDLPVTVPVQPFGAGAGRTMTARGDVTRYRLLASAIAGRLVDVAAVEEEHGPAWTDGATVFVDPDTDPRDVLCAIVVQASLLAAGSLDRDVVSTLGRRASVLRRYLALEGHRAVAAQERLLPAAARGLVDPELTARSDSPLGFAGTRARRCGHRRTAGGLRHDPAAAAATGDRPSTGCGAGHDGCATSRAALHEFDESPDRDAPVVDVGSSAVGRGGAVGRLLKKFFADARSQGGGAAGAAPPTHWTKRRARGTRGDAGVVGGGRAVRRGRARRARAPDVSRVGRQSRAVPARLVHGCRHGGRRAKRAAHRCSAMCTRCGDRSPGSAWIWSAGTANSKVTTSTSMPRSRRTCATRAGVAPEEAIYIDCLRSRRDLSVLVLLDVSGSAAEPGLTGKTVHEQQQAVAGALVVALHELGDRVALYGFRSSGRSAVHVIPIKRFDATLDARTLRRLGALEPAGYTRLGAAIRHGAAVLEEDGRHAEAGPRRRLRRVRLRPRLRGELRRSGSAARPGRGAPARHRVPLHQRRRDDRTGRVAPRVRLGRARNGPASRAAAGCRRSAVSCGTPRRGLPATCVAAHGARTRPIAKSSARPDDRLSVPHAAGRATSGSGRAIECPA